MGRRLAARFLVLSAMVLSVFGLVYSGEVDLERIVVTPYRYDETANKVPVSFTEITQGEIKSSNAQNIADVIRSVPGVLVRDLYGNGTKVTVDIGGFGEQGPLNVLVLIDGRRANDIDLSGVDWSQVPLDQVEKIEIIRGGSAAVLYGDNASSGVINIITKSGLGKPKLNLQAAYGSYDMSKQGVSLDGSINSKFSYWLSGSHETTQGYRDNTFSKGQDFASKLKYKFDDVFSLGFNSGFHVLSYGLPGALYQSNIDQYSRRYARYSDDHVNNKDYYFALAPKVEFPGAGRVDIDFNYRIKDTDSYFLSSGLDTQKNRIRTFGLMPKYTLDKSIFDRDNTLVAGFDFYRSIYTSNNYLISSEALNKYTHINKNSLGLYLQDEFSLLEKLILVGGYRYEFARYTFGYHDNDLHGWGKSPDIGSKLKTQINAFNTGITYTYNDESNIFLNVSRSFRFPEVDEFSYIDTNYQQQLNTELKPQSSINYQAGLRHKFSDWLKGSFSVFRMNVRNELYYKAQDVLVWGYWNGKNANYDRTVHQGLECAVEAKANSWLSLSGNYSFVNAYFDGGQYNRNEIPLSPKHKASLGFKLTLPKGVAFNMISTYVGERYYLNDQANAYSRLNGYMIADTNLSWSLKDFKVTFGINNLFDKSYSEYAGVNVDSGLAFYYPSPERNFNLRLDYTF